MFDAIFSWLLFFGMIMGVLCIITLINDLLTPRPPRIDIHIHPIRTVKELKHIIERDGEMYVFEETEDCMNND